jgi:2TM domain
MAASGATDDARAKAVKRIRRKRQFQQQVVIYALVNVFLWLIWAVGGFGFPWPIFVTFGWGIGIAAQGWVVYGGGKPITDEEIRREMEKGTDAA